MCVQHGIDPWMQGLAQIFARLVRKLPSCAYVCMLYAYVREHHGSWDAILAQIVLRLAHKHDVCAYVYVCVCICMYVMYVMYVCIYVYICMHISMYCMQNHVRV
jgi:hypothetical protein